MNNELLLTKNYKEGFEGGGGDPVFYFPKNNPPCVTSKFLFTEDEFMKYWSMSDFWNLRIWTYISLFVFVPITLVPSTFLIPYMFKAIREGDPLGISFFTTVVLLPYLSGLLFIIVIRHHTHPNPKRRYRDIELLYSELEIGRAVGFYGYFGLISGDLFRFSRAVGEAWNPTKEAPLGTRQFKPYGAILETHIYDDCITSGTNRELVIVDYRKDIYEIRESKDYLVIRNGKLIDAVVNKHHLEGIDPKALKRFIRLKKWGIKVSLSDFMYKIEAAPSPSSTLIV